MIDPTVLRTLCEGPDALDIPLAFERLKKLDSIAAPVVLAERALAELQRCREALPQLLDENAALREKLDEVEKARDYLAQHHGGHLPTCGGMDSVNQRCGCGYLEGTAYRDLESRLAALEEAGEKLVARTPRSCGCNACSICAAWESFSNLLRSDP